MEAIILAGGKGTRLHSITKDAIPKPAALVNGRPFIFYLIEELLKQGVERIVVAVSHLHEQLIKLIVEQFPGEDIVFSYEQVPLGTGGAIKQACTQLKHDLTVVLNGDSYIQFKLTELAQFHATGPHDGISVLVKHLNDISRFGCIEFDQSGVVSQFIEKGEVRNGYINTGVYLINKASIESFPGTAFSFENEVLSSLKLPLRAIEGKGEFIDIGVPDDYQKAHKIMAGKTS